MKPKMVWHGEMVYGSYWISAVGTSKVDVRNRIWREFLRMKCARHGWDLANVTNGQKSVARKQFRELDLQFTEYEIGGSAIVR